MGNKGGLGISLKIGQTSVLFVGCHLSSGHNNHKQRLESFRRIQKCLARTLAPRIYKHGMLASDCFDVTIYLGDLNSRTDLEINMVYRFIYEHNYDVYIYIYI